MKFDFDIHLFLQSLINSLNIIEHYMSGTVVSTENIEMSKTQCLPSRKWQTNDVPIETMLEFKGGCK